MHPDGLVDKVYNLWNRDPVQVSSEVLTLERHERRAGEAEPDELLRTEEQMRACVPAVITGAVVLALGVGASSKPRARGGEQSK